MNIELHGNNVVPGFFHQRPLDWSNVLQYLEIRHPQEITDTLVLNIVRRRLECDGCPLCYQEQFIKLYPRQLAFSLFLCATRFHEHSNHLMIMIFSAIETFPVDLMDYCIEKFHGDSLKPKTADTVIGEAMTLLFSFFDDFVATPESGNLQAIQLVRRRYHDCIRYIDAHGFTPLHGVCCALNIDIIRYFNEWHLEQDPHGRGGLYVMNDSGITSLDTLIDTQIDLTDVLTWFQSRGLLASRDVDDWLLIHRAAHSSSLSTIHFFLNLLPGGVLSQDDNGNLPLHLHLGLRYRAGNVFTEQDFDITRLLIQFGIANGGMGTIGGLLHPYPDDDTCCTLASLLAEGNAKRIWETIDECLNLAQSDENGKASIRQKLECNSVPIIIQEYLIDQCPKDYTFSLLLCLCRHGGSMCREDILRVMTKILKAIESCPETQLRYCFKKFYGIRSNSRMTQPPPLIVIGEALALMFNQSDDFTISPQTGSLAALAIVKRKYPTSILYFNKHGFTPLHGACGTRNKVIMRFYIEWHLEQHPSEAAGLYTMNKSGITPIDELIDTRQDITSILQWLQGKGLLTSQDARDWFLIHRAAYSSSTSTLGFLLNLYPQGAVAKNDDGNLPLHLYLALRHRRTDTFSNEDFGMLELLIRYGTMYGRIFSIGGLFEPCFEDETSCTLASILDTAGESNAEKVWEAIDSSLDGIDASILHSAIRNKECVFKDLLLKIVNRYGATMRDEHSNLPLHWAIKQGVNWDDGVSDIWKMNPSAVYELDGSGVHLFSLAASNSDISLPTLFELVSRSISIFCQD